MPNLKRTLCKTRAFDLRNQAVTTYICKPAIVQYSEMRKLEPALCKLVYMQCDSNELCKIVEITLPQAPDVTLVDLPKKWKIT